MYWRKRWSHTVLAGTLERGGCLGHSTPAGVCSVLWASVSALRGRYDEQSRILGQTVFPVALSLCDSLLTPHVSPQGASMLLGEVCVPQSPAVAWDRGQRSPGRAQQRVLLWVSSPMRRGPLGDH